MRQTYAWKVINKYRSKKKNDISNKISISEEYFMDILEGKVERLCQTTKEAQKQNQRTKKWKGTLRK